MTPESVETTVTAATAFSPEDDTWHAPGDDPWQTETTWWSFNVPERRMGGWLPAARRPNAGTVTWRVFVWDPTASDPTRLAYHRIEQDVPMPEGGDLRDLTFPGGGFSVQMLRPLMDYRVRYDDAARGFALDIEHRSVFAPSRFTPGEAPMVNHPHLDQLGHVVGTMTLAGEQIAIDCWSVRDRTWGARREHHSRPSSSRSPREYRVLHPGGPRWREVERQRGRGRIQYIFGHVDGATGFLGFVRVQDGDERGWSPMNVGWLLKDGEIGRLDKQHSRMRNHRDPRTGWSSHMDVELVDELGRTMVAEGHAVSHMSEHGAGANTLLRWDIEGRIGWGEDQDGWQPDHFAAMLRELRAVR